MLKKILRSDYMATTSEFEAIKQKFINAGVDEKIRIYTTTSGLTVEQFKDLLKHFPLQHLNKLEKAMA
jgi:hypothetical protein